LTGAFKRSAARIEKLAAERTGRPGAETKDDSTLEPKDAVGLCRTRWALTTAAPRVAMDADDGVIDAMTPDNVALMTLAVSGIGLLVWSR
jgi:hypothetical protein